MPEDLLQYIDQLVLVDRVETSLNVHLDDIQAGSEGVGHWKSTKFRLQRQRLAHNSSPWNRPQDARIRF